MNCSGADATCHHTLDGARGLRELPSKETIQERMPQTPSEQEREAAADGAATCVGGEPADGEPARSSSR